MLLLRKISLIIATLLGWGAIGFGQQQVNLSLRLDPLHSQGIEVSFGDNSTPGEALSVRPRQSDLVAVPTQKSKYKFYYDPTSVNWGKYCSCFSYTFYSERQGRWLQFDVKATPKHAFVDTRQRVIFIIGEGGQEADSGIVDLPLHSFEDEPPLIQTIKSKEEPLRVHLSGDTVEIPITNSAGLGVTVSDKAQLLLGQPALWDLDQVSPDRTISIGGGNNFVVKAGMPSAIKFRIVPNKLKALVATLSSIKPDKPHDTLSVTIEYAADEGGAPKTLVMKDIGIRFAPSFFALGAALLLGSLLGTGASQFLPKATWKGPAALLKQTGGNLIFSVVAEVVAILLVAGDSKFVLFNF